MQVSIQSWNYPPVVPGSTSVTVLDRQPTIVDLVAVDPSQKQFIGVYITALPTKGTLYQRLENGSRGSIVDFEYSAYVKVLLPSQLLPGCLSVCLSDCLSDCLSVCQCVSVSVCLPVCQCVSLVLFFPLSLHHLSLNRTFLCSIIRNIRNHHLYLSLVLLLLLLLLLLPHSF